jgi:glycosyltransferase involved in cell wall biosynthesis
VRREPTTVLLVVPWDQESGGVTSVARTLATSLQEAGHRPLFLFPGDDDRVRRGRSRLGFEAAWLNLRAPLLRGRRLHSLAGFLAYLPLALRELLALVRRERVSVVNVHYPIENGFWFALLRRLAPVRLVTSLHGSDVVPEDPADPPPLAGTRQLLRASDAVVAPSEGFARIVRELFPFAAARTIGIPNALDADAFAALLDPSHAAADADLASLVGGHPFIVCVAEYTTKKGHDVLVPAFARLRAAGREPLRLLLIGDGVLRDDVQRLVVAHGLADRVVFAGRRSPALVARALARAELFVLPSRACWTTARWPVAWATPGQWRCATGTRARPSRRRTWSARWRSRRRATRRPRERRPGARVRVVAGPAAVGAPAAAPELSLRPQHRRRRDALAEDDARGGGARLGGGRGGRAPRPPRPARRRPPRRPAARRARVRLSPGRAVVGPPRGAGGGARRGGGAPPARAHERGAGGQRAGAGARRRWRAAAAQQPARRAP